MDTATSNRVRFVVPVRSAGENLAACLGAIRDGDGGHLPVLVAFDGAPTPGEMDICDRFRADRLVAPGPRGPGAARNAGVHATSEDLVFFVDADVCLMPTAVTRAVTALRTHNAAGVVGAYTPRTTAAGVLSRLKNLQHSYGHRSSAGPVASFWAGCALVDRKAFLAVGGFDEELRYCEDIELGARLSRNGYTVIFDDGVEAMHLKRYTLGSWMRSEIVERAAPWTTLLLSGRVSPGVLNTGRTGQTGVAVAVLTGVAVAATRSWPARARVVVLGMIAAAATQPGLVRLALETESTLAALLMGPYLLAHHALGAAGAAVSVMRRFLTA